MTGGVLRGDVIEVLREHGDETFTACLCDPPYGLQFMSKSWDHGVPGVPYWAEVLRVLKPGAVLLAFGGTRTSHRLVCAIEDAGFEIADSLMWLYGSGFPKSRNIGKAIDKEAGAKRPQVGTWRPTGTARIKGNGNSGHGYDHGEQRDELPITAPATPLAATWEGYGTALKPAYEPIVLARKPRRATYAQTAVEHGSGALNVDGCRVQGAEGDGVWGSSNQMCQEGRTFNASPKGDEYRSAQSSSGRWPANLLLSHSEGCVRVGEKRVKGITGGKAAHCRQAPIGTFQEAATRPYFDHASPDGTEAVADWRCVEGCPVKALGEQSGESKSVGGNNPTTQSIGGRGAYQGGDNRGFFHLGDTGTAARFFPQFEGEWECEEGCPVKALGEQSGERPGSHNQRHDTPGDKFASSYSGGLPLELGQYCGHSDKGSAARFFPQFEGERFLYSAKSSRRERDAGLPEGQRSSHPCHKPLAVCRWLATLIRPPEEYLDDATLLIPFSGSGSEMIGAMQAGWRNIVGIELDNEYADIAEARIAHWREEMKANVLPLFAMAEAAS